VPDYRASSATAARRQLTALATWLERNGQADAAASLREGLEETVTVLKLVLPPAPRRLFATTNCIENLIGTLRHVTRNIKRWPTATCAGGGSGSACCAPPSWAIWAWLIYLIGSR
jgi:transposase-like protein